jgi:hypothetical protein
MSEAIADINYRADTHSMEVLFTDGSLYTYLLVPLPVYMAFMAAGSQGTFFNANIRNRFPYEKG